jgi:small subunit ribosomal protein S6
MASDKKNTYEGMFLISPAVTVEAEAGIKIVRGILDRHQGEVIVIKKWDERKLAYEIKGQKRGLYIIAYFNAPGASIAAIERDVNLSDDVLRVLVTDAGHMNKEEMEAVEPQPIQPREERPSWDRPSYGDRPDRGGDRGPRRDQPVEAAKD